MRVMRMQVVMMATVVIVMTEGADCEEDDSKAGNLVTMTIIMIMIKEAEMVITVVRKKRVEVMRKMMVRMIELGGRGKRKNDRTDGGHRMIVIVAAVVSSK